MFRVFLVVFTAAAGAGAAEPPENFRRENLVAWCIVPFDAAQRGPEARAAMLAELGLKRSAYDWRKQHVPEFEAEILAYREKGIDFFAFWSEHESAFALFERYELRPQIWRTLWTPKVEGEAAKVEAAARGFEALAKRTAEMRCKLGLYNHGGWGGEPANLVAVCERLHAMGYEHAGIVYNFHHAHGHLENWAAEFERMKPYLLCLNLNGMNDDAQPKILPIGEGKHEAAMIRAVIASGYDGPVGILDHRSEVDAEVALRANLAGLEAVLTNLTGESR